MIVPVDVNVMDVYVASRVIQRLSTRHINTNLIKLFCSLLHVVKHALY